MYGSHQELYSECRLNKYQTVCDRNGDQGRIPIRCEYRQDKLSSRFEEIHPTSVYCVLVFYLLTVCRKKGKILVLVVMVVGGDWGGGL